MIPTHIVKQDRETFTVIAGMGFEDEINNAKLVLNFDGEMRKGELFRACLHQRFDEFLDQFLIEEEA
jgi:hypothetical protein